MRIFSFCCVLLCLVTCSATAQEPPPAQPNEPPQESGQPEQAAQPETPPAADQQPAADTAAVFQEAFAGYKQAIREFEALRNEFQTADAQRRMAINSELNRYYESMTAKIDSMIDAALADYRAAPNSNEEVTNLLLQVAEHDIRGVRNEYKNSQGGDRYERALTIINALVEGEQAAEHPKLAMWGLMAAFTTNNYDKAAEYRSLAMKVGSFKTQPDQKDEAGTEVFMTAIRYADMIDSYRKLWAEEQAIREAEAEADDLPRVKLTTSKGDIVLELFENEAPNAVGNFVTLVKAGYYDGLYFHRVLPRFMAQGGCPDGDGMGGPGYSIPCECTAKNARNHFRGTLSMAHAGPDTGGSQFFLTFVPTTQLDGRHTVFGRVIEGMEVLSELQRIDPQKRRLGPDERETVLDKIVKAEVLRDRGHEYKFKKLPGR